MCHCVICHHDLGVEPHSVPGTIFSGTITVHVDSSAQSPTNNFLSNSHTRANGITPVGRMKTETDKRSRNIYVHVELAVLQGLQGQSRYIGVSLCRWSHFLFPSKVGPSSTFPSLMYCSARAIREGLLDSIQGLTLLPDGYTVGAGTLMTPLADQPPPDG